MTDPIYDHPDTLAIIQAGLHEDLRFGDDLTCRSLVPQGARLCGEIIAKDAGVVCGLAVFARVFALLADTHPEWAIQLDGLVADGTAVAAGTIVGRLDGDAATILKGERTALNLCQRLSGTATTTAAFVAAVAGTKARILDTRKTTPGLRLLQKHAVESGGGSNHRMGLYDQVLIKNNHIALMHGDPAAAVRRCRAQLPPTTIVEVEIDRVADLPGVIAAGADIVLLDNLGPDAVAEAVRVRGDARVLLEASGGITLDRARAFALAGVDRISTGALTHSVKALDLALHCQPDAEPVR